jgi:hypothetical protein
MTIPANVSLPLPSQVIDLSQRTRAVERTLTVDREKDGRCPLRTRAEG